MVLQAGVWHMQRRPEEARFEVMCAVDIYGKLGVADGAGACRVLAQQFGRRLNRSVASGQPTLNCELL